MGSSETTKLVVPEPGSACPPRAAAAKDAAAQGRSIGKYRLLRELGRGNCGVVYLAFDPFVDRRVALKLANPSPGGSAPAISEIDFLTEARSAGRLQHANIVGVYDAGIHAGAHFLVMEYVDGRTLGQIPVSELSPSRAVEIAYDCARALGYAHRANVLHRDIKPDNVIVRRDGVAKLMDFSIATVMQNQKVRPGSVLGTPKYMAPEQIAGVTIGPPTDLYSLGAVIYYMLAGRPPHQAGSQKELLRQIQCEKPPALRGLRPDLPPRLFAIVDRLLDLDPAKRFPTGDALAAELLKVWDRRGGVRTRGQLSESALMLAALKFGALMSPAEIEELMGAGQIRPITAGEHVIRQGQKDDHIYLLIAGSVRLGRSRPVLLAPGQVFGNLALPGEDAVALDAMAMSPGMILQITREALERCSVGCRYRVYQACTGMLQEQLVRRA